MLRPLDFMPTDVHPSLMVDRTELREELTADILRYLGRRDPRASGTWAVTGDKGSGKTILTRAVLEDVREKRSGSTVVVTVDCRERQSWRELLSQLGYGLMTELLELRKIERDVVSESLLAEAQLIDELARLDRAELRILHEHAQSFKAHLKLVAATSELLSSLRVDLGFDMGVDVRRVKGLSGMRTFDEDRLSRALCGLCQDIRAAGLGVVVYLDNIDELRHEYHDVESRRRIRRDVEGLLRLREAPIALVLNMRTYFSRVLPRQLPTPPLRLGPLPEQDLLGILDKRVRHESPEVQRGFEQPEAREAVERLAKLAPTALAFLTWVHYLYRRDYLALERLEQGFSRYVYSAYSTVDENQVRRLMDEFDTPTTSIDRERLLAACEGNEEILHKLEDLQVVLPGDFWSPQTYTLDPLFQTFHLALVGSGR
ncbi:MAG: ATP-binding protein [Myxococcota bacterium]